MFQILIAKLDANCKLQKVGVIRATNAGKVSLPKAWQGQTSGYVAKDSAAYFADEGASSQLDYQLPGGIFRATKLSSWNPGPHHICVHTDQGVQYLPPQN